MIAANGRDIAAWLFDAVVASGITWRLLLGVIGAEADFSLTAERWGTRTPEALVALDAGDHDTLRNIVATEWPDISFGPSQHTIPYHYYGDKSRSLDNILAVRAYVFAHPDIDILQMAFNLAWRRQVILSRNVDLSPVNGDIDLATAVSYNRGSYPDPDDSYWTRYAANVERYRDSFADVDRRMAGLTIVE